MGARRRILRQSSPKDNGNAKMANGIARAAKKFFPAADSELSASGVASGMQRRCSIQKSGGKKTCRNSGAQSVKNIANVAEPAASIK